MKNVTRVHSKKVHKKEKFDVKNFFAGGAQRKLNAQNIFNNE